MTPEWPPVRHGNPQRSWSLVGQQAREDQFRPSNIYAIGRMGSGKKKIDIWSSCSKLSGPTWHPSHPAPHKPFARLLVVPPAQPAKWPQNPQMRPATPCSPRRAPASPALCRAGQPHSRFEVSFSEILLLSSSDWVSRSPSAVLKRSILRARRKSSTSAATGRSPSCRTISKMTRSPS